MTNDDRTFFRIGGAAAWLQLAMITLVIVAGVALGPWPTTAEGYFTMYGQNPLLGLLQDDFSSLLIIVLYLGTFPALFLALRRHNLPVMFYATLLAVIGVSFSIAIQSSFSLLNLSEAYAAATTPAEQARLLAAGEAIIASNLWNTTAGFLGGIFLQGAGVLASLVMLKSDDFWKVTAYAGLLANGMDLTQHLIHPFAPEAAGLIIMLAGPFYLAWFPLLGRDLLRLGRAANHKNRVIVSAGV